MNKNIKMILEIIVISIALGFLEFQLLIKNGSIANIFAIILIGIVSFKLIIKFIKDISIKRDGVLKLIFRILFLFLNFVILFTCFYPYIINKNGNALLENISLIGTGIISCYLLVSGIINIINIKKEKGTLYINVKDGLFNILFFILIVIAIIINIF